jgi:hypothetical protein
MEKTDKICILVLVRDSKMNLNNEEASVPMETSISGLKPPWPMVVHSKKQATLTIDTSNGPLLLAGSLNAYLQIRLD